MIVHDCKWIDLAAQREKEGRKEGRKSLFGKSIHKLVVFTNTIISSLEDHTKTVMRSLS